MAEEEFNREEILTHVGWRWTAAPTTLAGFHPSVLLGFPAFLISLLSMEVLIGWGVYIAFVGFILFRTKMTPFEYARMMFTKYIVGNSWSVR